MGFKAYRFTAQSEDSWILAEPEPLRFSGPNGLLAQWYRLNRGAVGDSSWLVTGQEWLALALGGEEAAQHWIIFEQTAAGTRQLARLERIHGQFATETRIMMQFRPLKCSSSTPSLVVTEPASSCCWCEELSIDGGGNSSACTWRWMAPKLVFASVVAG